MRLCVWPPRRRGPGVPVVQHKEDSANRHFPSSVVMRLVVTVDFSRDSADRHRALVHQDKDSEDHLLKAHHRDKDSEDHLFKAHHRETFSKARL